MLREAKIRLEELETRLRLNQEELEDFKRTDKRNKMRI
jgi:hypothetical protein